MKGKVEEENEKNEIRSLGLLNFSGPPDAITVRASSSSRHFPAHHHQSPPSSPPSRPPH